MTTNSARPELLAQFSADLARRSRTTAATVDEVTMAFARYHATCPDGLPLPRPDLDAHQVLGRTAALATGVDQIGAAFARADRQGGATVATASDLALSDAIIAVAPGLFTGVLAEPRRWHEELARRTGAQLAEFADHQAWAQAQELLRRLPEEATDDPQFGAVLFAQLTPHQVLVLANGLFAYGGAQGTEIGTGIRCFSRLHNAATSVWAAQPRDRDLPEIGLHDELARSSVGRDALRLLFTTSHLAPSASVLIGAVVPLYDLGGAINPGTEDEVTRVVDGALHGPELSGPDHDVGRHQLMNRLVTVAAADPRGVDEPLATMLAESVFDDQRFWVERSQRGIPTDRAQITSAFEAIARHDDSFLTLAAGLEVHQREYLAGAVAPIPINDAGDLADLDDLSARLAAGAARADRPDDQWAWAFAAVHAGLDVAQTAIPAGAKTAKIVLRPVVDAGLDWWHQNTIPDPGTKQDQVERQRTRRRANAWAAVAAEPTLATRLDLTVGDGTPMSVDALRSLGTDPDAVTTLGAWERGQPDDLVTLVDRLSGSS